MNLDSLRKITAEDLSRIPDGIKIYVKCKSEAAIDTTWLDGWYKKQDKVLQKYNGGYININDNNFEFYVRFKYSLPLAQQLLFDVATELHTGFEGINKDILAEKIYDVVRDIDRMELW